LLPQPVRTNAGNPDHIGGRRRTPNPSVGHPNDNRCCSSDRDRYDSGPSMPQRRSRVGKARVRQQPKDYHQKSQNPHDDYGHELLPPRGNDSPVDVRRPGRLRRYQKRLTKSVSPSQNGRLEFSSSFFA
jgi:hypothetical protein